MSYTRTVDPTVEPVTLAEAKAHLNVTVSTDDTLIGALIQAAREHTETFTNRALVSQTWKLLMDDFPEWELRISKPPLISITSIKYYDINNSQQTLVENTDFTKDKFSQPGWVVPGIDGWPSVYSDGINAVEIIFVAGYEDSSASPVDLADKIPQAIKTAILLLVGHLYEHRESVSDFQVHTVPMGYEALLYSYRILNL